MDDSQLASVGVVIVNWNGWPYTVAACRSLGQSLHRNFKIVIVDNASVDDSLLQLRAAVPNADIISNQRNEGFSGGCNIGIRHALGLGCDYIFLLNNDAMVDDLTIEQLVSVSRDLHDRVLLGSVIHDAASGDHVFFGNRAGSVLGSQINFTISDDVQKLDQKLIETDFIVGAALFLPAKLLSRIGLFDERFFLNFEETDLCYRARKLDIPSFVVSSSRIRHHGGASVGPYHAPMQAYFLTRNRLLFADKHGSFARRFQLYILNLKWIYWSLRKSWAAARTVDLPTRAMARACWDYMLRRFGDCPAVIRQYDARYREQSHAPSSTGGAAVP